MAGIEVEAENELSAVILFMQHVSLPEAVYFQAFKILRTKGIFLVATLLYARYKSLKKTVCVVGVWPYSHLTGQAVTSLCVYFSI